MPLQKVASLRDKSLLARGASWLQPGASLPTAKTACQVQVGGKARHPRRSLAVPQITNGPLSTGKSLYCASSKLSGASISSSVISRMSRGLGREPGKLFSSRSWGDRSKLSFSRWAWSS